MKRLFIYDPENPRREVALQMAVECVRDWGGRVEVTVSEPTRTLDQNAAMWPSLRDFAAQVPLQIVQKNGGMRGATEYDWKDVLTAAFEEETEWAPGLRGGVVMLGARTSKYGKRKMGDFLTFVRAEGDERGVRWSEPAKQMFDEYIPRRVA